MRVLATLINYILLGLSDIPDAGLGLDEQISTHMYGKH